MVAGTRTRGRTSARRPRHRPAPVRRIRLGWRSRLILVAIVVPVTLIAWAATARRLALASNTSLNRFDTIIVLGDSADADGNPTPAQLARVTEAVHEYERGVAPRLIMTGGAVVNQFVEARVMARTAEAQGVPASAILVEPEATDTIQNACYSVRIMKSHGWRSAEVVSGPSHLARTGLIMSRLPVEWRVHAAPPMRPESTTYAMAMSALETLKTARYLVWSRQVEGCEP